MNFSSRPARFVLLVLLAGCLMVLAKFILFKNPPQDYKHFFKADFIKQSVQRGLKNANLKPFKTIELMQGRSVSTKYSLANIGGNLAGFIPLGILFPMLFLSLRKVWKTVAVIFFISLGFECIQLCTGLGVFDVDDLILNTAGGLLGYIFYKLAAVFFKI